MDLCIFYTSKETGHISRKLRSVYIFLENWLHIYGPLQCVHIRSQNGYWFMKDFIIYTYVWKLVSHL